MVCCVVPLEPGWTLVRVPPHCSRAPPHQPLIQSRGWLVGAGAGAEVGVASCVLAACGMSDCTARAAFSAARASARFFGIGTSIARATGLACATGLHMQRDSHVRQDLHEDSHVQKDRMCDRTCMYVQQRTCTCVRTRMCNRTFTCNRTRTCEGCNAPHLPAASKQCLFVCCCMHALQIAGKHKHTLLG